MHVHLSSRLCCAQTSQVNIYLPGDFFKTHADTPRQSDRPGECAFASLVVLLPVPFEGGELLVRHEGSEAVWRGTALPVTSEAPLAEPQPMQFKPSAQTHLSWAAFYADCEHEVMSLPWMPH